MSAVETPQPPAALPGSPIAASAGKDRAIRAAVRQRIATDAVTVSPSIEVRSRDGLVELTGKTDSLLGKERATRLAEAVEGVRSVSNRIAIVRPEIADTQIARDVREALGRDPVTADRRLDVSVHDGVVVLRGDVRSLPERSFAEKAAKSVRGVAAVENLIDLVAGTPRTDDDIRWDVTQRLRWDALVGDALVVVKVRNGAVELLGEVGTAAEKERAVEDAGVSGATSIEAARLVVKPWLRRTDLRRSESVDVRDADIVRAIERAVAYDPRVATRVRVVVGDRIATLRGVVPNLAAKNAAESIARHTLGVAAVDDEITVRSDVPVTDDVIERRLAYALATNPLTRGGAIAADVSSGAVRLRGSVESVSTRDEAERIAATLGGVRSISDELEIASHGDEAASRPGTHSIDENRGLLVPR